MSNSVKDIYNNGLEDEELQTKCQLEVVFNNGNNIIISENKNNDQKGKEDIIYGNEIDDNDKNIAIRKIGMTNKSDLNNNDNVPDAALLEKENIWISHGIPIIICNNFRKANNNILHHQRNPTRNRRIENNPKTVTEVVAFQRELENCKWICKEIQVVPIDV